ncbi:hypothetical protein CJF31_00006049 [Rutstroemia sp. NJR-2017a BVV2]|nr:hypothetical protein CJF31_00010175 [Rutstroemia sp. NJR-2017a BVV2]PQE25190.1 hypothetical protein CJF31_00006049 [Rutstroemia sp. NJR-2017a BVV2]
MSGNSRYGSSQSDGSRSGGSNKAQYYGTSRSGTSGSSSEETRSGFSNFSQNPDADRYISSTYPRTNPPSAQTYRTTQGVPQNPIQYGNYDGRTSTSTNPTRPDGQRDVYRNAVADGVPADSAMARLNEEYKRADAKAEETKETYRNYRKEHAASGSDIKAEKKAREKNSKLQRTYRGLPAGTRRFHEHAISLVRHAIHWAEVTNRLRTEMAATYVATEPSKKSADGHQKRASDKAKSADKLRENLREHLKAIDDFNQAEAAVASELAAQAARMTVADEESSDNEPPRRRRTNQDPKGKGKAREERSRSRGGTQRRSGR